MVRDINNLGGIQSPIPNTAGDRSSKKSTAADSPASAAPSTGDSVELSSEAKTLQSLGSQLNSLPEVNTQRAEEIKAALERGDYQINDLVVADKLLNTEALLSS